MHGIAVFSLRLLPVVSTPDTHIPITTFEASQAVVAGTHGLAPPIPEPTAPPLSGGAESVSTLDRTGPATRGGDGAALEAGVQLFSFTSDLTLTDTELNNFEKSQTHRLRTSDERASLEQRRATPRPTDAVFLASGQGTHAERRKTAARDSAPGALRGGDTRPSDRPPKVLATGEGAPPRPLAHAPTSLRGILKGRGERASARAAVATARPNVDRGPAATTAPISDERVRDDVDAELLAARIERSFVEASSQRALRNGPGAGGEQEARPQAGFGATPQGDGARALPHLPGPGAEGVLDTSDARYVRWFMELRARVQRALVFPEERALAMDQGTTVYRVIVGRDGRMKATPTLVRSSGFVDLDKAAVSAILEAAPFAPLPLELLPERPEVAILMPVQFWNPMVR
jgi:TonB family protein